MSSPIDDNDTLLRTDWLNRDALARSRSYLESPTNREPPSDDAAFDPLVKGEMIEGGYEVGERLGSGGMGVVYRGTDTRLQRPVAIKIMRPDRLEGPWPQQFIHEARLMAGIHDPNVVDVYHLGAVGELPYFVMAYVQGRELRAWITEQGLAPDVDQAFELIHNLCRGVQAIHDAGAIHRDLKPENVLIRSDLSLAITDFGLSQLLSAGADKLGEALAGTPAYIAPELITHSTQPDLATRIDVYALGVMAYELLTGSLPFGGAGRPLWILQAQVYETPEAPSIRRPELTDAYDHIFARVLAKDPAERFGSPQEFHSALSMAYESVKLRKRCPRILVVDDEETHLDYVIEMLRIHVPHAHVIGTTDASSVLSRCRISPPDLVLTDLCMPEIDGMRLVQDVRSDPRLAGSKLVVMTGAGGSESWKQLDALGCDDILLKPFDGSKLSSVVRRFIPLLGPGSTEL